LNVGGGVVVVDVVGGVVVVVVVAAAAAAAAAAGVAGVPLDLAPVVCRYTLHEHAHGGVIHATAGVAAEYLEVGISLRTLLGIKRSANTLHTTKPLTEHALDLVWPRRLRFLSLGQTDRRTVSVCYWNDRIRPMACCVLTAGLLHGVDM